MYVLFTLFMSSVEAVGYINLDFTVLMITISDFTFAVSLLFSSNVTSSLEASRCL